MEDTVLRVWRHRATPPSEAAAAKWLHQADAGAAGPLAPVPAPTPSASQLAPAVAANLGRLIAAPHQPRASKWATYAPNSTASHTPQPSSGSALAAPGWGHAAAWDAADELSLGRAASNSPPPHHSMQQRQQEQAPGPPGGHATAYPPEVECFQSQAGPLSGGRPVPYVPPQHTGPGSHTLDFERPHYQQQQWQRQQHQRQHQQRWQQQDHRQQQRQQPAMQLDGPPSQRATAIGPPHGGAAAPAAAELMMFVQHQGQHSAPMDAAVHAWQEHGTAGGHGRAPATSGSKLAAPQLHTALQQVHRQAVGLGAGGMRSWPQPGPADLPVAPAAETAPPRRQSPPGAASAPRAAQRQSVLVSAGKFVLPSKVLPASAWQAPPAALHPHNQEPKQQQQPRKSGTTLGQRLAAAAAAAEVAAAAPSEGPPQRTGKDKGRAKSGGTSADRAPAAPGAGPASDCDGAKVERLAPAAKRQRRQAGAAEAAAGRGAATAAAEPAAAWEALEVGPWLGVVDACTPLGCSRFAADMQRAPSCSIGLLLVDGSGSQFHSTLQPLTKQQQQLIKAAAVAAAGGSKKPRASGKGKAAAAVAAAPAATPPAAAKAASAGAGSRAVALCVLPIHVDAQTGSGSPGEALYFVPLAAGVWGGHEVGEAAAVQGREMAGQLLATERGGGAVAYNMQGLLRLLGEAGVCVPPPHRLALVDPRLLGWLLEPQLLQGSDKELSDYSLAELADRHLGGMPAGAAADGNAGPAAAAWVSAVGGGAAAAAPSPLRRVRRALEAAVALGERLTALLAEAQLPPEATQREMQVAALVARMEGRGLGFDPWLLRRAGATARARMARLEEECASLAGRPFNLASPQQLADVLYSQLGLPPPTGRGPSAKAHLPTDETALEGLKPLSPLPSLVLEYRVLQNFASKWVEAEWCRAAAEGFATAEEYAAAHPAAGGWPRVRCSWNQAATATGRLSSAAPNLQAGRGAVTKYELEALGAPGMVRIRDAFVAPRGCVLLSADYSQVELRVLAHLSGDPALVALLQRVGPEGDAFNLIASTWLGRGDPAGVSEEDRAKAKQVTYGIIYGLTPYGLTKGPSALGCSLQAAQELIRSFLSHFKGVAAYVEATKASARVQGGVRTLTGRRRPIKGLHSTDARVRAEAERKAVNTTIQGSAADLLKCAMLDWCRWREAAVQPPARIVAQLHDELMVEVDASRVDVAWVARELRRVMEGAARLRVPLAATVKAGQRWGSMAAVE